MSPISPISPTSPMDLSPISPVEAAMILDLPTTPVIAPAIYLPRLLTSFQTSSSGLSSSRRTSLQFQLPTPSPLSLGRTPSTWTGGSRTSGSHTDGVWIRSPVTVDHGESQSKLQSQSPPWHGSNPFGTPVVVRRVPKLMRQNANEGFEKLEGEVYSLCDSESESESAEEPDSTEESISLPLRVNTVIPDSATRASPRRHSSAIERSPTKPSTPLSKTQSRSTTLPPTSRSRSPIRKTKNQRKPLYNHRRLTRPRKSTSKPTPKLHIHSPPTPTTLLRQTDLTARLSHLSRKLVPLVSVTTGLPHPEFPTNLLRYQLLTHEQLDELARWYHQTSGAGRERWMYPCPVLRGKAWCYGGRDERRGGDGSERRDGNGDVEGEVGGVDLETKRRRWGRFIGLQGCESPVENEDGNDDGESESIEEIEERMEREWHEALRRARESERVREKIWRGRF